MKIAIDLRSLSSGRVSGVENYCLNLLEYLPKADSHTQYTFFYNSMRRRKLPDFHFVNSDTVHTQFPSKFLNFALKFGLIKLESVMGKSDWVFMPNLNQFSLNPHTKVAITVHDLSPVVSPEFYDIKRRLWHKFLGYKKAFDRANVLFAVSQYTKNDLMIIFNIPEHKIKVIYPGVDHKVFNPNISLEDLRQVRNHYSLPGKFILFLNTVEPRKNLAGLVKAFEKMDKETHLVIAGRKGWKYSRDFRLIKNSRKSDKIHYIGYVEEKHKPALIKLARVLIYPSFYEGFGFQALEAMAVGTPVVVSQLTSLPEVVGDAGLLINPYDESLMAEGLERALNNEELREQLISKGIERASKFPWENTAKQILHHLRSF